MAELFKQLESNNKAEREQAREKILNQISNVKDPWIMNGLFDYYLSTNSTNIIIILVNIKEFHCNMLFDKLSDSLKHTKGDVKVQALTLLGHVVRHQPTWFYRIQDHPLLKDLLLLLKNEFEILPLISALLVLIVLIPMIPSAMGTFLADVFRIFSRLASWDCSPGRSVEDQMIHMQVALYALFLRLYGMYPCNFLVYLRTQYKDKNNPVFIHTIKPMLETVKMNPSLVTTSKDNETASERWKTIAVHDIIVECERFSLDVSDTFCTHDSCQFASGFRSRSGTTSNSALESSYFQSLKSLAASMSSNDRTDFFTPNMILHPQSNNTPNNTTLSAYVPQPEFTHDENIVPQAGSSPPEAAIEATPETTPIIQEDLQYTQRVQSMGSNSQPQSPIRKEKSPFNFPLENSKNYEEFQLAPVMKSPSGKKLNKTPLTSPLKIKAGSEESRKSPTLSLNNDDLLLTDKKVESSQPVLKQSDSVLNESEDSASETVDEDRSSPCTAGGLHMPNTKSMNEFKRHVQRLRHHSQCNPEPDQSLSGSSPENDLTKVRRTNSCPEMKKSPVSSVKDNFSETLDETDEDETNAERAESVMSNGFDTMMLDKVCNETQTDNLWPMPYEHLFLGIFPTLGEEVKSSPVQAGGNLQESSRSVYEILDRYIDTAVHDNDRDSLPYYKKQLELVQYQLQFERYRRETHALKNRRFMSDARKHQVLQEHNSALRDQVQLQQTEIDNLQEQLAKVANQRQLDNERYEDTIFGLEEKCKLLEAVNKQSREEENTIKKSSDENNSRILTLMLEKQKVEASLLEALIEVKFAKEQALAGEKGRAELEYANKQLVLMGELQIKYREKLDELSSLRRSDQELDLLKESYKTEINMLHDRLRDKSAKIELFTAKIGELEQVIIQKEESISAQKRTLASVNTEHEEMIKALQSKYQTQLAISRTMDERLLDLYGQLELSAKKPIGSPDTSSCQEVQVSSEKISGAAMALSQRSSPLSCSLTSSDGSLALLQSDVQKGDVRGLQALVSGENSPIDANAQDSIETQASTSSSTKK